MSIFKRKTPSAQQLLGIDEITDHSIRTPNGELVYLILKPSNLNVLPESIVRQRIHSLMNVLKGMAEVEILATDSKESYQDNRSFYRKRLEEDIICGPFFLVGDDHEGGFCSLTDDQIQKYTAQFQEPEQFTGHEPELKPRMDIFFMEGL